MQFWNPQRGGEYEVQCARGRGYAQELLDHMRAEDNPLLFGSVMRGITAGGVVEGVEVGFFSRLGIELVGLGS